MSVRVFISYASADEALADRFHVALKGRSVPSFLASKSLAVGDKFAAEIATIIPQCDAFVLVWSEAATKSPHVEREIGLAAAAKLKFFPIKIDATVYEGEALYYLSQFNWEQFSEEGAEGVARAIAEHLRVVDAQYPFGDLYRELLAGGMDFDAHLESLRLLARFVAIVHASKYVQGVERDPEMNTAVEQLLTLTSLFSDLDVARRLFEWLDRHGNSVHDGFREFFKLPLAKLPTAGQFDKSDHAADTFDEENLHLLLGVRNVLAPLAPANDPYPTLCKAAREFLRKAIALEWSSVPLSISVIEPGGTRRRVPVKAAETLSPDEASQAFVDLSLQGGHLGLHPFVSLFSRSSDDVPELGLFRSQNGTSRYSTISTKPSVFENRPPIAVPWGRVEILRTIPETIYIGETHVIGLRLTNHSAGPVHVGQIDEHLPENIESLAGEASVSVANALELAPDEMRQLDYEVRGTSIPGAKRSFSRRVITYQFLGRNNTVEIAGDGEVWVQTVPPSSLVVSHTIKDFKGDSIGASVARDTEVTVEVEIQSRGQRTAEVVIADIVEGGEVTSGSLVLHQGTIERLDRQSPIHSWYTMRVSGEQELVIEARATTAGNALPIAKATIRTGITILPPPRLELRWRRVARSGPRELYAQLRIANTGGTSAHNVRLAVDTPADVEVRSLEEPPPRLHPGDEHTATFRIYWSGATSDELLFKVVSSSASGLGVEGQLPLNLLGIVERDVKSLPLVGREDARAAVRAALTDADSIVVNLFGERGTGKLRLLLDQVDRLQQIEGRSVGMYTIDCGTADSFVEALTTLLEQLIFATNPEMRGSNTVLKQFLRDVGMDEAQYAGPVSDLEHLIHQREKPHAGMWNSVAIALAKIARVRYRDGLLLVLKDVSEFSRKEFDALAALRRHLVSTHVRIAVTSEDALKLPAIDREIQVERLSEDDCRALIRSVFVMPEPSSTLEREIVEKSERLPANLISILERLVAEPAWLDSSSPAGVRLRDWNQFQEAPTTLVESERRTAEQSGQPPLLLACIGAVRGPFSAAHLQSAANRIGVHISQQALRDTIEKCVKQHWVHVTGPEMVVPSATIRTALEGLASSEQREQIHQALFTLYMEDGRSLQLCFPHLVAAPAAFIKAHHAQLVHGLRDMLAQGRFSQVRSIRRRLTSARIDLPEADDVELRIIDHELQWEETGRVEPAKVEELLQRVSSVRPRARRIAFRARLSLVRSQWFARQQNMERAIAEAESAKERFGPFWLGIDDRALEFDVQLNLWEMYYRALDETRFRRIDRWIWKRLKRKRNGAHDTYEIARFLGLFLDLQRELPDAAAREKHFPVLWTTILGERRPLRDNAIDLLTRTERLRDSFLDQYLGQPDRLNLENMVVLGRLYLDLGAALWKQAGKAEDSVSARKEAESYLVRAETLFVSARFPLDSAIARKVIGDTYLDRIADERDRASKERLVSLYSLAARWLHSAATDFHSIDAANEEAESWDAYANVMFQWSGVQADRIDDAISAHERLLTMPAVSQSPERADAIRLKLVGLYEKTGRLIEADRVLDQMTTTIFEVIEHRAIIHAQMLETGSAAMTPSNLPDLEQDLERLRRIPAGRSQNEALAIITWHVAELYRRQARAGDALRVLRMNRIELMASPTTSPRLRTEGPAVLCDLWQMDGTADGQITQDFTVFVLPGIGPENRKAVEEMLDRIWEWPPAPDATRRLAAADMSLVLCESSLTRRGSLPEQLALAQRVLARLVNLDSYNPESTAPFLARALAVVLRTAEPSQDDRQFIQEFDDIRRRLEDEQRWDAALNMQMHLIECLLHTHRHTQNRWYYTVIGKIAVHLRPLQELGRANFDLMIRLIGLYLQLPKRLADAVELMEQLCQQLLDDQNYSLLPEYLSFLSDLLDSAIHEDTDIAKLIQAVSQHTEATSPEQLFASSDSAAEIQTERTRTIKRVATELCRKIIDDLRRHSLERDSWRGVLYNAAKLLNDPAANDLRTAIYVKLYEVANEVDGSCVWGTYTSWVAGHTDTPPLSLEDQIALTTFANCRQEAGDGSWLEANPRNYLINTRGRNLLVQQLANRPSSSRDVFVAFGQMEVGRLTFIRHLVSRFQKTLEGLTEFQKLAWITFFYGHLFSDRDDAPLWEKVRRIEGFGAEVETNIETLLQRMASMGAFDPHARAEQEMAKLAGRAEEFLTSFRRRGREIMSQLAERIRPMTIGEILGEVQQYLGTQQRSLEFDAILGLSAAVAIDDAKDDGDEGFLNRDPGLLVVPLLENGYRLLQREELVLAARVLRFALNLCESRGGDEHDAVPAILRGLTTSLRQQGLFDEALATGLRQLKVEEDKKTPTRSSTLALVGDILDEGGRPTESVPYYERAVALDEERLGTEHPALIHPLHGLGLTLRKIGSLTRAEGAFRRAIALDEQQNQNDPQIRHRIYNLALILILEDHFGEARQQIERAWAMKVGTVDRITTRLLFARIAIAFLQGQPASLFIGQLRGLMRSDDPLFVPKYARKTSDLTQTIAYFRSRIPQQASFLEVLGTSVNDLSRTSALDSFDLWTQQDPVSIGVSWPT